MNLPNNFFSTHYLSTGFLLADYFSAKKNGLIIFLLSCLLFMPALSTAKTSDADQVLHIEADSVEIRERQGISIYQGNVSISRGSMLIKGQLIHITRKKNNTFIIKVEGKPAQFKQLNDSNQQISAQSQHMTFASDSGILTLDKAAILNQGENKFTSEHIIYNTQQDIVQAGKNRQTPTDSSKPERVSITIQQPAKEDNSVKAIQ